MVGRSQTLNNKNSLFNFSKVEMSCLSVWSSLHLWSRANRSGGLAGGCLEYACSHTGRHSYSIKKKKLSEGACLNLKSMWAKWKHFISHFINIWKHDGTNLCILTRWCKKKKIKKRLSINEASMFLYRENKQEGPLPLAWISYNDMQTPASF